MHQVSQCSPYEARFDEVISSTVLSLDGSLEVGLLGLLIVEIFVIGYTSIIVGVKTRSCTTCAIVSCGSSLPICCVCMP